MDIIIAGLLLLANWWAPSAAVFEEGWNLIQGTVDITVKEGIQGHRKVEVKFDWQE